MAIVVCGLYCFARLGLPSLIACLCGLLVARVAVKRFTRLTCLKPPCASRPTNSSSGNTASSSSTATIVTTWGLMLVLAIGAYLITRKLTSDVITSRWQAALEILVTGIDEQIKEVGLSVPARYVAFIGTLFIFIATANLLTIVPGIRASDQLTLDDRGARRMRVRGGAGFRRRAGAAGARYLKSYLEPTVIMLPFNLISELSRTLALAVRLFGNMMSGTMIIAILLTITPFIFPVAMTAARAADRHGAGLHLQHPCDGLHRRRHRG